VFDASEEMYKIEGCIRVNWHLEGVDLLGLELKRGWRTRVGYLVVILYPLKGEFIATDDCVKLGDSCLD
jgi:hypothetical protein